MFTAAIITTLLDQLTKYLAVWWFVEPGGEHIGIIRGFFHLCLVYNDGAAWGLFPGWRFILIAVSALMLVFIICQHRELAKGGRLSRIMTGVLTGGITGNLIDRVLTGKVIDFLDFHWEGVYYFPVFNVADSAICVGMFCMVLSQFLRKKKV